MSVSVSEVFGTDFTNYEAVEKLAYKLATPDQPQAIIRRTRNGKVCYNITFLSTAMRSLQREPGELVHWTRPSPAAARRIVDEQ